MKTIGPILLAALLCLPGIKAMGFYGISACRVEVTDRTGKVQLMNLAKTDYDYYHVFNFDRQNELSPSFTNQSEYIKIIVSNRPVHCYWIAISFIKEISFSWDNPAAVKMKILMFNDSIIGGTPGFSMTGANLCGVSTFGASKLRFDRIRKISILSYTTDNYDHADKTEIKREEAIRIYKRFFYNMKVYPDNNDLYNKRFTLRDGKNIYKASGLYFSDKYLKTREDLLYTYNGQYDTFYEQFYALKLAIGDAIVFLDFNNTREVVLTGNLIGLSPEIKVKMNSGDSTVARLLTLTKNENEPEYGKVENEDMFYWNCEFGLEGLSILPLRKMDIRFKED